MSLRQQAEQDMLGIVESATDFGWSITVTSPAGASASMTGLSTDIGTTLDPETGLPISGRRASVALTMRTLLAEFSAFPQGTYDGSTKPWIVTFDDINGVSMAFRVVSTHPDRAIGLITCVVERYSDAG